MIVSIDEIVKHLRIGGANELALLALYEGAASEYIKAFTNRDFVDEDVPFAVKAAALLLIGDLYENREAQGPALHENRTVERLLWPHRVF
jgi:hypothetical protein